MFYVFYFRYKDDPWLWDFEWDVKEFKQLAASKKKCSKQAAETQAATPLPDCEDGIYSDPGPP